MTKEELPAYWRSLVDKQAESGLSVGVFCREHNLSRDRFYYWRRRFRNQQANGIYAGGFVQLVPYQKKSSAGVRIRLSDGLCIELEKGFDPVTLRGAIQVLCNTGPRPCLP